MDRTNKILWFFLILILYLIGIGIISFVNEISQPKTQTLTEVTTGGNSKDILIITSTLPISFTAMYKTEFALVSTNGITAVQAISNTDLIDQAYDKGLIYPGTYIYTNRGLVRLFSKIPFTYTWKPVDDRDLFFQIMVIFIYIWPIIAIPFIRLTYKIGSRSEEESEDTSQ